MTPTSTATGPAAPANGSKWAFIARLCGAVGLGSWIFYAFIFHLQPFQDWMVFYSAARAYIDGDLAVIFDGVRFTALLNEHFANLLGVPLVLHPWIYPPTYLFVHRKAVRCAYFVLGLRRTVSARDVRNPRRCDPRRGGTRAATIGGFWSFIRASLSGRALQRLLPGRTHFISTAALLLGGFPRFSAAAARRARRHGTCPPHHRLGRNSALWCRWQLVGGPAMADELAAADRRRRCPRAPEPRRLRSRSVAVLVRVYVAPERSLPKTGL